MKRLSDNQTSFFAICEQSLPKLRELSGKARLLRLFILERELMAIEKQIRDALDLQARAFRTDSLCEPEPLFPQGYFPYGRKDRTGD